MRSSTSRRRAVALVLMLGSLALVGACSSSGGDDSTTPTSGPRTLTNSPTPSDSGNVVSAPIAGRHSAHLVVASGVTTSRIRTDDLGDDLYRVSTPDGSSIQPTVGLSGDTVTVETRSGGGPGGSSLAIELSSRVSWGVQLDGGATSELLDLSRGPVDEVDLASGATRIELYLPRPTSTVRIGESGGASELIIHAPTGVPVRVTAGGGASEVELDGVVHRGISGGTTFTTPGWSSADGRYFVDAVGGVSSIRVDRKAAPA